MALLLHVVRDGFTFVTARSLQTLLTGEHQQELASLAQVQANPELAADVDLALVYNWPDLSKLRLPSKTKIAVLLAESYSLAGHPARQKLGESLEQIDYLLLTDAQLYQSFRPAQQLPPAVPVPLGFNPGDCPVANQPDTEHGRLGILVNRWFGVPEMQTARHKTCLDQLKTAAQQVGWTKLVEVRRPQDMLACQACAVGVWGGLDDSLLIREALLMGKPVLAEDQAHWLPLICHGRSGWLADLQQPQGLLDGLQALRKNQWLYSKPATLWRAQSAARHVWPAQAPAWRFLIRQLIEWN